MTERTSYEPGTPSWVDNASADPGAAVRFYSALFGWETENSMPEGADGEYHVARLRGKEVAALAGQPIEGAPAVWNTYVTVVDVDAKAVTVAEAGGQVMMEPFDVLDAGRMAVFADPAGAVFMGWQPSRMIGASLVNEAGALGWNELVTGEIEASKAFYGAVFGWQTSSMEFAGGEYTIWHLAGAEPKQAPPDEGGNGIGGMIPIDNWPDGTPPFWLVYFGVEDTDATAARAGELGGAVALPAFDAPGVGRIAGLTDPNGALFCVMAPEA
jgi:uncharacterized protein